MAYLLVTNYGQPWLTIAEAIFVTRRAPPIPKIKMREKETKKKQRINHHPIGHQPLNLMENEDKHLKMTNKDV